MDEKVLREVKIVETEDGFRIEMKGDKEELRKLLFDQSRPFFAWGEGRPFSGRGPFGGRGAFEHLREQHERHHHEHHHDHDQEHGREQEHQRGPFGFRGEPRPEGTGDPRVEALRAAGRKLKRGYDLGPWWDESAASDEPDAKL